MYQAHPAASVPTTGQNNETANTATAAEGTTIGQRGTGALFVPAAAIP